MRVVGGELKGRRLRVPQDGVRPTSDRVREAVFSALGDVRGRRVLDLYAGSGALGIEALSRGASHCVFVDRSSRSLRVLGQNLEDLSLKPRSRVIRGEARRRVRSWTSAPGPGPFDLVFLDPPYALEELEGVLSALAEGALLAPDAEVVVESAKRHSWSLPEGFTRIDERSYGDTSITRLVKTSDTGGPGGPGRSDERPCGS